MLTIGDALLELVITWDRRAAREALRRADREHTPANERRLTDRYDRLVEAEARRGAA